MLNNKKGYSLTVLVITIAVIIIITTTAVISIKDISKDREISKFMNDLEEVQQFVIEYFAQNNSLPAIYENDKMKSAEKELIQLLSGDNVLSQLNEEDVGEYYYVDITKLGKIHLDDNDRGYIVNEGTLNIYVINPCRYEETNYYTLTPYLLGEEILEKESAPFQINIMGNPITWVERANILVSIPNVKVGEAEGWNFKWLEGARTATEFKEYEGAGNKVNYFVYGDIITFTENGIYTVYVENPEKLAVVRKVVISKIDDIAPTIKYVSGEVYLDDGQTGISEIRCKITENTTFRIDQSTKEQFPEYFVQSPELFSDTPETFLSKYLWGDENIKGETIEQYLKKYESFYSEYTRYNSVLLDIEATSGERENAIAAIIQLNNTYPQFAYDTRRYSDAERNIVIYVEDMVGNATVYSAINRDELINMQYVSSDALTLIDSQVVINNNRSHTNTRDVSLYLQSLYAKSVFITEEKIPNPTWENFDYTVADYTLSEGDGEKIVYAFFRDNNGKTQGVFDKIFLDTTEPTSDAPTVTGTLNAISIIVNQTDSNIVDGVEKQSGIANVTYGVKEGTDGAWIWYNKPSLIPRLTAGITYSFVTRAVDKAGNEQVSEEATIRFAGDTIGDSVQVGDYVQYTPDTAVDSSIAWRVWKIESNGDVVITPTEPLGSLTLGGATLEEAVASYKVAESTIETECDKYKSTALDVTEDDVRSVTISDLEDSKVSSLATYKTTFAGGAGFGKIATYTSGTFYMKYNARTDENEHLASAVTATTENSVTLLQDYYRASTTEAGWKLLNVTKFGSETYGTILAGDSWLASPCVEYYLSRAEFNVHRAYNGEIGGYGVYNSEGEYYDTPSFGVRPLITLDSSLKVDTSDASKNGSSSTNAWVIAK